jgi:MFS family permease
VGGFYLARHPADDRRGGAVRSGTGRDANRPATYRDVLASPEYRAIYVASALSWIGDATARAAVTALVFQATDSAAASAGAFALTYAPWLLGGSLLVSLAERYPHRTVMVTCDVARVLIMAVVAIPQVPLPVVLGLVLVAAFFAPPFDAARSANLPAVLKGERYVLGLAMSTATNQPAQVVGYLLGSALSISDPRLAFALNAISFGLSALLIRIFVHRRRPGLAQGQRTDLLHETGDGFKMVFGTPALRSIMLLVFGGVLFVVVPEGLGAAWAGRLADDGNRGWIQGMIMAAVPAGSIVGSVLVTRLVPPDTLVRLMRPLAVVVPATLVPAVFSPSASAVVVLAGLCGVAMGALGPVANGQFVRRLPHEYRARAFGVVQAGMHLTQGFAVVATGLLAQKFAVPTVVGVWSIVGVVLMLALVLRWPAGPVLSPAPASAIDASDSGDVAPPASVARVPLQADPSPSHRPAARGWFAAITGGTRRRAAAGPPGTMEP